MAAKGKRTGDVKVTFVKSGGKARVSSLEVSWTSTLGTIREALAAEWKMDKYRLSFFVMDAEGKKIRLNNLLDTLAESYQGEMDDVTVSVRDLGPQVSYRGVFFWEYIGPLVIYLICYQYGPGLFGEDWKAENGKPQSELDVMDVAVILWSFHYVKRLLETFFVHRFSHATMPQRNLIRNCGYYWGASLAIGYFINHPGFTGHGNLPLLYLGVAVFALGELLNFYCHIKLRNLRPAEGSQNRPIPKGFLFDTFWCPNYTAEFVSWVGFNIAVPSVSGVAFLLLGGLQMYAWAGTKKSKYVKIAQEEKVDLPRRWKMFPFM